VTKFYVVTYKEKGAQMLWLWPSYTHRIFWKI